MHKSASQEEVTSLHDLSAVDLIAGFRAKQFSPSVQASLSKCGIAVPPGTPQRMVSTS